jgi:H/ACA ribonucleoprotein complex subunit 2
VLAGDVSPIDVITHVPVLCEDAGVPYVFVPSKEALGQAGQTKRPTSVMLVLPRPLKKGGDAGMSTEDDDAFTEEFEKVHAKLKTQAPVFTRTHE